MLADERPVLHTVLEKQPRCGRLLRAHDDLRPFQ
jgi:hypothetical protein